MANCRFCGTTLRHSFVDLGMQPLCESFISSQQLNQMEPFYPLHPLVCHNCFLVQLEEYVNPGDIFTDYAYYSSYSDSWLQHSQKYVDMIIKRLKLNQASQVIEIASNDGYLLQYFLGTDIPILGIEPAANTAKDAIKKGIPTLIEFFNTDTAKQLKVDGKQADLVIGNNVLAQVPPLNDFVEGINIILKPQGVATLEFPHLMRLMDENQFDTIYHEHFSYFSLITSEAIFAAHNMKIHHVEELSTHGGSLRIYASHLDDKSHPIGDKVVELKERELDAGFNKIETYLNFHEQVKQTKRKSLAMLIKAKEQEKKIVGYGAPGKGNTFLNYCGIGPDFLDYVVDRNPHKQGKYLPGTHIPIYHPDKVKETKPDYLMILPWNLKKEIMRQNNFISDWGGKFMTMIPEPLILSPKNRGENT